MLFAFDWLMNQTDEAYTELRSRCRNTHFGPFSA